jgi:hypothetical protein
MMRASFFVDFGAQWGALPRLTKRDWPCDGLSNDPHPQKTTRWLDAGYFRIAVSL